MRKHKITQEDYFHDAAIALKESFGVSMAQAHDLTSASLGYMSKKAALDDGVDPQDQWLHRHDPNLEMIGSVVQRLNGVDNEKLLKQLDAVGDVIRESLAPSCEDSGIRSKHNIPVGDPKEGDTCKWIHPSVARDNRSDYAFCPLCGDHTAYHVDDLDGHGLCPEHRGEFDLDSEEQEDLESFIEYHTKDN